MGGFEFMERSESTGQYLCTLGLAVVLQEVELGLDEGELMRLKEGGGDVKAAAILHDCIQIVPLRDLGVEPPQRAGFVRM